MMKPCMMIITVLCLSGLILAGQSPREMHVYRGTTPTLDGIIGSREYQDATRFNSFGLWGPAFNPTTDALDLSVTGYIKHDGRDLYLAFDVTDDVLYAFDTDRWLSEENPRCHEFSPTGWSWFGDGVEVFMNPSYVWSEYDSRGEGDRWQDVQFNDGSGRSWQMACSASKSWLGGLGKGGIMPAEQRVNVSTFQTYINWIKRGDQKAILTIKPDRKGYVVEWMIKGDPCLEVKPGVFWTPDYGTAKLGFNLAIQDLDEKEKGTGNFGHLNHEDWWAGAKRRPYQLQHFGTLHLHPGLRPHEIYVGSNEAVQTLHQAQTRVRQLVKQGLDRDVLVILKQGRYQLDRPLILTAQDSGTKHHAVTYTAFPAYTWPGDRVVISGGHTLSGWEKSEDQLWQASVPGALSIRQLFKNNCRLPRSRTPNQGYLRIQKPNGNYTQLECDYLPAFDPAQRLTELVTIQNWALCRGIVTDSKANTLTLATPMAWLGHSALRAKAGNPAYLENHPSFIDQDGEWCFNPHTHTITYQAPQGENPNEQVFTVPVLEHLVVGEGTSAQPIQNLHFRAIAFEHTTWALPRIGYRGIQAGYYGTSEKPPEPVFCQPAAVEYRFVQDSSFELCDIAHTGATGLGLGAGCRRVRVAGCRITDTGNNGIQVGHRRDALMGPSNVLDKDWDTEREIPTANVVVSNLISACGQISSGAVGIFDSFADSTRIAHNLIMDTPYTGISVGYRWNTQPSSQKNTRVEYNRIVNVLNDVVDGGGIYTLGVQPGTIFRGNLIYEVHRSDFGHGAPNNGFFLDEGSKDFVLEENIVFATSGKPVRHNRNDPQGHTWKNNFFDVSPGDRGFPWSIAGQAGLEGAYRDKVLKRD
jgi:hypothetical protein